MRVRIAFLTEKITSSFWIIPSSITIFLIVILFVLTEIEITSENIFLQQIFFLKSRPDAVRLLLSSIATSIMTVLGVVFSILIVVIQQMSTQYSPRIVSNFTRSKLAQFVLGLYVGTFNYNLVLLMNIGNESMPNPIPRLAVVFAGMLGISCLIALIFYIHHVTRSIQSTEIISTIARESITTLRNVASEQKEKSSGPFPMQKDLHHLFVYKSEKIGYIDVIHWKTFLNKIQNKKWILHFHVNPGNFLQKGTPIFSLRSNQKINEKDFSEIDEMISISSERTMAQDPFFGLEKLCDIALKALSPGINDPSTAIESIHSMTSIILEFIRGPSWRSEICMDKEKFIMFSIIDLKYLLKISFDHILTFSNSHGPVKDLIRENLRFIQREEITLDLKQYLEDKIAAI